MEYKHYRDFPASLIALKEKGGKFSKASEKIYSMIIISKTNPDPLKTFNTTNHGEKRIKKCIKYKLSGGVRLITIRDNGIVVLCFCGTHPDCDKWLNNNKGRTLICDQNNQIDLVSMNLFELDNSDSPPPSLLKGKLYEFIDEQYFDKLVANIRTRSVVRRLEELESFDEEDIIFEIVQNIDDSKLSSTIYDVFCLLRLDKRLEALDRIKIFLGENTPIEELTPEEIKNLADSENIINLKSDHPHFQEAFEHFVKNSKYMDWMLFLHPDQKRIVYQHFNGPAKLLGVSGSGKTCIAVHRAKHLAYKYPTQKILVLTLNRQLSHLMSDMVNNLCPNEIRKQIDVKPFFTLCQELLTQFEPKNTKLYDDVTWKSREHIDEVWREFYRCELNNEDASILQPIHDSLISRGINGEKYIREEFDWIRSAGGNQINYLNLERTGRYHPLDTRQRTILQTALYYWEKKMRAVGITDYLGLSSALFKHIKKVTPQYRCIIVDEIQDFGTNELRLIRKLVSKNHNDLFLCGDAAQQVLTKHCVFKHADIKIGSRSHKINKNYRNSREILKAANFVFNNHSPKDISSNDFEILDPEFANFSASAPLLLSAKNLEHEIAFALILAQEEIEDGVDRKACIAFCGFTLYQIQKYGQEIEIPVLDGETLVGNDKIFFSDLEHTKGFEFDTVIILNCNEGIIPDSTKPEEEQYRDLARLYVAMTRAKRQLVLSFSKKPSRLLNGVDEFFLLDKWDTYNIDSEKISLRGTPSLLEEIIAGDDISLAPDLLDLSGPEFLYREEAIGIESLLIEKLRVLISGGHNVNRNGHRIKWKNIRNANTDTKNSPVSRNTFGPKGIKLFQELIKNISVE
jgi:superfamily I DNA/RNA helicase